MDKLREIPIGALAIIVGAVTAIGWIVFEGTVPLVISIIAGSLIALRSTLGDPEGPVD